MKFKLFILSLFLVYISGCGLSEEQATRIMLEAVEKAYNTDFEVVDYNYNKGNHTHEIGVQTDITSTNLATMVFLEDKDKVYDNFNSNIYSTNINKEVSDNFKTLGNCISYTSSSIKLFDNTKSGISFNDFIKKLSEKSSHYTVVFLDTNVSTNTIIEKAKEILLSLDMANLDIKVYVVNAKEVSDVEWSIYRNYKFYTGESPTEFYEDCFTVEVKKRDGIISEVVYSD